MLTKRPRGTSDILPNEVKMWQYLEDIARNISYEYDYQEIRTPIFEHTELFNRGVGETTDIVEKEMYDFQDKGGRSITLKPEGTAPVVRAYLENKLYAEAQPVKLFYLSPMFRYGRPQAGRMRQFHQFGIEVFGSKDPGVDAEVIGMAMSYYSRIGLENLKLLINSVGCRNCRPFISEQLKEYLAPEKNKLCKTCIGRFKHNPLRIYDCKNADCQSVIKGAPDPLDAVCEECRRHFKIVRDYLELIGVDYEVDGKMVRGLDYYTHTTFEITAPGLGAQSSIGGGGRYDNLVYTCGGPDVPAIGFGLGLERTLLALEAQKVRLPTASGRDVFIVTLSGDPDGNEAKEGFKIMSQLRKEGLSADKDYAGRSLRAQMKHADRKGFSFAVIVGGEELERGELIVREMKTGRQYNTPADQAVSELKKSIRG